MGMRSTPPIAAVETFVRRLSFALPEPKRKYLYQSTLAASHIDGEYVGMLGLAGLIALFGLLQNSEAVIIGAMLISPLMNPILSAALALLLGDGSLGRKSAMILAVSIAGVIAVTWLVAWLSPLKQATPQILSRTNPNLLDLFIAFLSGLAGTLALRGSSASLTIIPGVAIAVAVVPPLAVTGYGLSTHQSAVAGGAFLLFVTNLVAIIISAALVFRLMGFRPRGAAEKGRLNLAYRMALSGGILIVLSIPLFQTLRKAVGQIGLRATVEDALNAAFKTPHSSVSDFAVTQVSSGVEVHATLRTTKYFETGQIDTAEESLRQLLGSGAKLDVDQILVTQGGIKPQQAATQGNALSGGVVRPVVQTPPFSFKESAGKMLSDLQKQLGELLAGTTVQPIGEPRVELAPTLAVTVQLESPQPLDAQSVGLLSSQLSTRLSMPAQLRGEVRLTGEGYKSSLEIPKSRRTLALKERRNLVQLAKLVSQRPDLRLQITYLPASGETKGAAWPPLLLQIQRALTANGLKPGQCVIQAGSEPTAHPTAPAPPSVGTKAPSGPAMPAATGQVDYEFQVNQVF